MSPWLLVGALVAGWIDAVIGGGGLVMLPLLMASGLAPTTALATNKLMSSLGTGSATITRSGPLRCSLRQGGPIE